MGLGDLPGPPRRPDRRRGGVIAEGDRVVVRGALRGTHEGEGRMGVAPPARRRPRA